MEIQQGKGPWASPVTGIVPLGTTLTMVVGIDDKEGKTFKIYFDPLVKISIVTYTFGFFFLSLAKMQV